MNPLFITPILEIGKTIFNRLLPDKQAQADAELKLAELVQAGEFKALDAQLQMALAQSQTNTAEATNGNWFRAGWRPYIGWVCGTGLAYQLLARPLLQMAIGLAGSDVQMVALEMETLKTLLFGMLGLGAMRTYEKVKSVA